MKTTRYTMMKYTTVMKIFKLRIQIMSALLFFAFATVEAQTVIGPGEQPQITVDSKGLVRIVYGNNGKIFYATSTDKGESFSKPGLIAEVPEMHLGMTRGPQLSSSKDY